MKALINSQEKSGLWKGNEFRTGFWRTASHADKLLLPHLIE